MCVGHANAAREEHASEEAHDICRSVVMIELCLIRYLCRNSVAGRQRSRNPEGRQQCSAASIEAAADVRQRSPPSGRLPLPGRPCGSGAPSALPPEYRCRPAVCCLQVRNVWLSPASLPQARPSSLVYGALALSKCSCAAVEFSVCRAVSKQ